VLSGCHISTIRRSLVEVCEYSLERIRITRSGSTDVTHRFVFATIEDAAGDTENLGTCTLPGCRPVLTTEAIPTWTSRCCPETGWCSTPPPTSTFVPRKV